MSDTENQLANLSRDDLIRLLKRANFVKEQQAARIGAVMTENLELVGIIQEQNEEIEKLRAGESVPHPEVLADVTS